MEGRKREARSSSPDATPTAKRRRRRFKNREGSADCNVSVIGQGSITRALSNASSLVRGPGHSGYVDLTSYPRSQLLDLPMEIQREICQQLPPERFRVDLASMVIVSQTSAYYQSKQLAFREIGFEKVHFQSQQQHRITTRQYDLLEKNRDLIHSLSGTISEHHALSDSLLHILFRIPSSNLRMLAINGALNLFTLPLFQLALEKQDLLQFFTIPGYAIKKNWKYNEIQEGHTIKTEQSELYMRMSHRRSAMDANGLLIWLIPDQLLDGVEVYAQLKRKYNSASPYIPTFHVYAADRAPLDLVRRYISHRNDTTKSKVTSATIIRAVGALPDRVLQFPRDTPFSTPLEIPEIKVSEMSLQVASNHVHSTLSIPNVRTLALHMCCHTAGFLLALCTFSSANRGVLHLREFLYWHACTLATYREYSALLHAMPLFLKSFTGLRHLHIEYPNALSGPEEDSDSESGSDVDSDTGADTQSNTDPVATSDDEEASRGYECYGTWNIADWIGNHKDLETISVNFGHCYISPRDMDALADLHMLGGVGTQFHVIADYVCDGNLEQLEAECARLSEWLSPVQNVRYLYLFAPEPERSLPITPEEFEDVASTICGLLDKHARNLANPWYLTVGFRDIDDDDLNNIPQYCHLRMHRDSQLSRSISERALPYALEKFGDKRGFNASEIKKRHMHVPE